MSGIGPVRQMWVAPGLVAALLTSGGAPAQAASSYVVTLTVTDDRGGTDTGPLTVKCTRKNQNKPTTCS